MKEILIVYNDLFFLDFIKIFLLKKNLFVKVVSNGLEAIKVAKAQNSDLLIIDKNMRGIELEGFLIKKRLIPDLRDKPVFLIGDFISTELQKFKEDNIKAFISVPINPEALFERIALFFNLPLHIKSEKTPMLVDMHSKGNILIIQIEGNFEEDKLEMLNYEIRSFCRKKDILNPRFFFIIPSLYPESITAENIDVLFKFITFPELNIKKHHIKLLTQCNPFLDKLALMGQYKHFEIVQNFIDGIQKLNLDFDNRKEINLAHLKENTSYIFDLFDEDGSVRIPALTKVTRDMIDYLIKSGEKKLSYYSDSLIEENDDKQVVSSKIAQKNFDMIISDYEQLDEDIDILKHINDKMTLFFRKLKSYKILVISNNKKNNELIKKILSSYSSIEILEESDSLPDLKNGKYILVFIDMNFNSADPIELLRKIRTFVSKKETTVIITSETVSLDILDKLKKNGTDNVLLSPFSTTEVMKKVFNSVSIDRGFI